VHSCGYGARALRLLGIEADAQIGLQIGFDGTTRGDECGNDYDVEAVDFALPGDQPVYGPDRPADIHHVDIDVRLDFGERIVRGLVTTHYTALFDEVREVRLDAAELVIEQVTLAGTKTALSSWTEGERLIIALDRPYHHGEQFAVSVHYWAKPRVGLVFIGPMEGNPDLPVQAWTQGQTEYHHFWFPCHDSPNDRATTALTATVPADFFALSNGWLEGADENGDGTKTYRWRQDFPHPAYLVTLVAGKFSELPDKWRAVPVNYYVRPGREDDGHRMFDNTPRMIELYSQRFGVDYAYAKYAQIVPEMFLGAMENTSATTHSYRLLPDVRASLDWTPEPVVAHELVHQWFGDLLTCRDWGHIWLNESFATYFEAVWIEHSKGQDEFRAELRQNLRNYLEADRHGRRPIVYNVYRKNGQELFDRHVYEKGSLVLHLLRFVLGESAFWRGIQLYTQRNRGREVITADLERALEEATGRSLARFFEQWVYKAGHPEFKVSYSWDDEHSMARLTVKQTQQVTEQTPLFVTPVEIGFMVPTSDRARADDPKAGATFQTFRAQIDSAEQTFYFPLPRRPFMVRFDEGSHIIKTLEFKRPAELLRYQLRHDPDVLGRIEAAEALGKLADPESNSALQQALIAEPFHAVRAAIAEALGQQRTERALDALVGALDTVEEPKARRAIVAALGHFRAPEQAALAERAARKLVDILQHGEPSYFVEAAAATALGKTRASGAYDWLLPLLDKPSWNETIRGGAFAGLGELGEARVVELLADWMLDRVHPMDARAMAAAGLRVLASTKRVDSREAETKAVEALIAALDDPWELVQVNAIGALGEWGDMRAIPALERFITSAADERGVRAARRAILRLQRGRRAGDETRKLRSDLEHVREENRKLRARLEALETRLNGFAAANGANGASVGKAPSASRRRAAVNGSASPRAATGAGARRPRKPQPTT
jgi:aminopeptidase N